MAVRLGYVLYWAGCLVGLVWIAFWSLAVLTHQNAGTPEYVVVFGPALAFWLTGRAVRYVLAGQ
jgi:hypothetical protein